MKDTPLMQDLYLVHDVIQYEGIDYLIGIYSTLEIAKSKAEIYFSKLLYPSLDECMIVEVISHFGDVIVDDIDHESVIDYAWTYTPEKGWSA